jgi:hypothetical protein
VIVDGFIDHVAHFPDSLLESLVDDSDVTIAVPTTIDTTSGTITPALGGGLVLESIAQNVGNNVMLIEAGSLSISAEVKVVGDKPLVLVGRRRITITSLGVIDVSADGDIPGPGGFASGAGPGSGQAGQSDTAGTDGGGGGGASFGFAQFGTGGFPLGGLPGTSYGDGTALEQLIGGSGGGEPGTPEPCTVHGGAGGGALQLTAGVLVFDGSIDAGGGGGSGGQACGSNGSGGGGGGAGGLVYVDAGSWWYGHGSFGATGGAGGQGAGPVGQRGGTGGDATITSGGSPTFSSAAGGAGGNGAGIKAYAPTAQTAGGDAEVGHNTGGGGGGFGGIYFHTNRCALDLFHFHSSPRPKATLPWRGPCP